MYPAWTISPVARNLTLFSLINNGLYKWTHTNRSLQEINHKNVCLSADWHFQMPLSGGLGYSSWNPKRAKVFLQQRRMGNHCLQAIPRCFQVCFTHLRGREKGWQVCELILLSYPLAKVAVYRVERHIGKCQLEIQFPVKAACWLQWNLCQTCTCNIYDLGCFRGWS